MDPPSSYPSLQKHLADLVSDTPPELDDRLVETFTAQLTETNTPALILPLAPPLTLALQALQTDPTPITVLLQRLLSSVPFTHLLSLTTPEQLLDTITSPSPAVQSLGLFLLRKATVGEAEVAVVAGWSKIVAALLNLAFLGTDTGASGEAAEVLVALLEKDKNVGLLWRRVFTDPAVYRGFYEATKGEGKVTTEAQGRLLGIVARLVERVGWERVVKAGGDPAVEREFMTGTGGLLEYAAAKMVKPDEDVVMHLLLLEFYGALLAAAPAEAWAYLSSLDKAKSIVILAIAPESHTEDELDRGLLQSRASSVLAEVISNIPATLSAPTTPDVTTPLIEDIIGVIKAHLINPYGGPHRPSLTLLHALPEDSIVGQGIVPLLPLSPPQYEFLATLAQLLAHERLFREYASANNQMWELVVKYASSPALGDISELAFDIIEAVSSWGVMEVVKAPGVMLLLANAPERGFGGDVANSVARRRWEVAGKVLERLPEGNGWRKVLDKRVKAGIWGKGGSGAGGEVATMRM